jgi:hypothetical protein
VSPQVAVLRRFPVSDPVNTTGLGNVARNFPGRFRGEKGAEIRDVIPPFARRQFVEFLVDRAESPEGARRLNR